jgi:hypothetical protein
VLALIHSDEPDIAKKVKTEDLVGIKIKEDLFIDLCNVGKSLSDYAVEGDYNLNEIVAINEDE